MVTAINAFDYLIYVKFSLPFRLKSQNFLKVMSFKFSKVNLILTR